jgi:hypothetical protein
MNVMIPESPYYPAQRGPVPYHGYLYRTLFARTLLAQGAPARRAEPTLSPNPK